MPGRWRATLRRALALPPHILAQKVARVATRKARQHFGRTRDRLLGTSISTAQLLAACRGQFATAAALAAHFRTRSSPRFFLAARDRQPFGNQIRAALAPEIASSTMRQADDVLAHRFDLLGSGPVELGAKIDWHADFKSGHRWPAHVYYADCQYAPERGGFDIKVPWELCRLQHLVWLGQTYWLTGDTNYVREFKAQVSDWIAENPPRRGVNWTCTMDVAIRAVNLVWAYELCRTSPLLDDEFHLRLVTSLLAHGRHILGNLEWSPELTSNHYLSNIAGLIYLGIYVPEIAEAAYWRDFGLAELAGEIRKQVYDDGADFEASISYHRLVLELFYSPALLARLNGLDLPADFWQRLERMFEFTLHVTQPNGAVPQFGDNDNGRLHRLQAWPVARREWTDHRYLLAIGAVLFDRADFAAAAGDQWAEAVWLFGPETIAKHRRAGQMPQTLALASCAFTDAGIYVQRHRDAYLAVSVRPPGQNSVGGHSHQDLLSFVLTIGFQDWLVDPGTYLYTADYAARNAFRATAAHNTLVIDGAEQNRLPADHLFHTTYDARARVVCWQSNSEFDLLVAEHTGYERLPGKVVHRRTFYFDKSRIAWLIVDELRGTGQHTATGALHLAAEVKPHFVLPSDVRLCGPETVDASSGTLRIVSPDLPFRVESGELSPSYGVRVPGHVLRYDLAVDLDRPQPHRLAMAIFFEPATQAEQGSGADLARRLSELEQALGRSLEDNAVEANRENSL